jgi:hypothetical protein
MGFFSTTKRQKKLFPFVQLDSFLVARRNWKTYNLYLGTNANISFFGVKSAGLLHAYWVLLRAK